MKKKIGLAGLLLTIASTTYAQVGVNTPDPKSTFDINAKNATGTSRNPEGLLIPRVDRAREQAITNVAISTMIYVDNVSTGTQTGTSINIDKQGFYFYDGTAWVKMKSEATAAIYDADGSLKSDRTVDHGNKKLSFTATETNAFSVDGNTFSVDAANNRIGLGTAAPMGKLDITADNSTRSVDKEVFIRGFGSSKNPKIYMSSANGTAAAPTNLATDDVIGTMEFVPRANNAFP